MNRTHILALIGVVLAGCNAENDVLESNTVPEKNEAAEKEDIVPAQREDTKDSSEPTSAEKFVEDFKKAYAAGDAAAIEEMVHWEGPADNKEMMLKILLSSGSSGGGTITKAELREPAEDDAKPWATLKPEAILDYTATNEDDSFSKNTSVPVVKVDGQYYFYIAAMPAKEE